MSYLVIARKYRPRTFEEVVGQPAVAQTLKNAIELSRVAHAYLFAGPRGVGKTSSARILARALCCEKGPTADPCGSCTRCDAILRGSDLDVIEIDAASNRGIDDIRSLRENARMSPMSGDTKFYIIDEVHQLTSEAFNALLKILEEPPPHVLFVLATTEPEKIPDTIRSRCQFFEFGRVSTAGIADRLRSICEQEKVTFEEDALQVIARASRGGVRDSQSLLDQVITFGGGKVTADGALAVTGALSSEAVSALVRAVIEGQLPVILDELSELDRKGVAPESILEALLREFRAVMIASAAGPSALEADAPAFVAELAANVDVDRSIALVNLLVSGRRRIKEHDDPRLPLETLLLRLGRAGAGMPIDQAIAALRGSSAGAPASGLTRPTGGNSGAAQSRSAPAQASASRSPRAPGAAAAAATSPSGSPASGDADAAWRAVVAAVQTRSGPLGAFMLDFSACSFEGDVLSVSRAGKTGGIYKLGDSRVQKVLEEATTKVLGRAVEIREEVGQAPAEPPRRSRSVVDRAKEMFDGQVID